MNATIKKYLVINSDILDNKYLIQYKLDKQSNSDKKLQMHKQNVYQTYHI